LICAVFRTFDPSDSLHPLVKSGTDVCGREFFAGDEGISGEDKSKWVIGGFGDADARGGLDILSAEGVFANPQAGGGSSEIGAIVAGAGDGEGLGEASGAAGELMAMARAGQRNSAGVGHFFEAEKRFECAKENAASFAFGFT